MKDLPFDKLQAPIKISTMFSTQIRMADVISRATSAHSVLGENVAALIRTTSLSSGYVQQLSDSARAWQKIFDSINTVTLSSVVGSASLANAASAAMDYVAEHSDDLPEEATAEMVDLQDRKAAWTVSDYLTVFGLLLNILFFVIGQLPDPQDAKQIEQQETIIKQNDEIISIDREQLESSKRTEQTMYTIAQHLEVLTKELHDSGVLIQDSGDVDDSEHQSSDNHALGNP